MAVSPSETLLVYAAGSKSHIKRNQPSVNGGHFSDVDGISTRGRERQKDSLPCMSPRAPVDPSMVTPDSRNAVVGFATVLDRLISSLYVDGPNSNHADGIS